MAASQLPRHDFAPAWLKLPNNENSAWKQGTGDRLFYQPAGGGGGGSGGERSLSRLSRSNASARSSTTYDDIVTQPQSVNSHQQFARPRFYSSDYNDDNDLALNEGASLRTSARLGHSTRSQSQANGVFLEQQHVGFSARNNTVAVNGSHAAIKKLQRSKDGRSGSLSSNGQVRRFESIKSTTTNTVPTLDDEFPSLNGETTAENAKPANSKVVSVWDSPSRQAKNISRSASSGVEAGHKALVLKTGSAKRWTSGLNKPSSGMKDTGKEPTAPAEGLNTCLVTHPKNICDKKSNFLRSLKRESHESDQELNEEASSSGPTSPAGQECDKMAANFDCGDNGSEEMLNASAVSTPIEINLSSSHEAEQRLLREMGWRETDEEDEHYEITEADVREFENLRRRLEDNCKSTKKRNGFAHELPTMITAARTLSVPIYIRDVPLPVLDPDSDSLSDSSDDVDDFVQKVS